MNPIVLTEDQKDLKPKRGRPFESEIRRNRKPIKGQLRVAGRRGHYTEAEKMNAACVFAVSGNSRRVAEITRIPEATIRCWKNQEWWHEVQSAIVREQDEELDVKLTKLVDKAVDAVNERLDNGDYVYNAKADKLVRKPVGAKDLAIVTAITVDKRQLLRGQPTSRIEKVSTDERLLKLAKQFKEFTQAKEVIQEIEVIENGD